METTKECANCMCKLEEVGQGLKIVADGVVNMDGEIVTLENVQYFCCERCLAEYYNSGDVPSLPPRVP